ncbi:ABC transporter substrate-binding protein [Sphaerisporangium flaviroseum]|uniref:ABC transporter substrate-binding protein n=1 Tax=Sphaerisporangium flaviroseum TaxID=509199 RepID=A0ABP7I3I6_9ACTN
MTRVRRGRSGLTALLASAAVALAGCGGPDGAAQRSGLAPARALPGVTTTATPTAPTPTATGSDSPSAAPPSASVSPSPLVSPKALGPLEGSVTVLTYRGYAEYGGSDPQFNWVGPFESSTGCRVNLRFPQASDQMDKFLAQTAYDVVSAPPDIAGRLIAEKKVVPLTTSLIPGYDDIPQWLRSQRSATAGGDQVYGLPYLWGSYMTLYDSARTHPGKGATIYSDRGPVMFRDSPLSIADAALALKKQRPKLGVKDPFELTPRQLDAAMALITERRGVERSFWKDPIDALQGFAGESVRMGRALPYHLDLLRGAGWPVKVLDDGPTTGWVDSWMVSAQAPSPNCAYKWLDWIGSAKVQQQAAVWNGLAPANPDACTWAPKKSYETEKSRRQTERASRICAGYRVGDTAWLKKIHFAVRPVSDCEGRDGECTDYAEWAARWQQLVK